MIADWLDNLAAHLAANSLGTVGTDIFKLRLPAALDPATVATVLTPTQGLPGKYRYNEPRVQVLVRSTDDSAAWSRAFAVYNLLNNPTRFTVGASTARTGFLMSQPLQPPFFIGTDAAGASLIAVNFQLTIQDLN